MQLFERDYRVNASGMLLYKMPITLERNANNLKPRSIASIIMKLSITFTI